MPRFEVKNCSLVISVLMITSLLDQHTNKPHQPHHSPSLLFPCQQMLTWIFLCFSIYSVAPRKWVYPREEHGVCSLGGQHTRQNCPTWDNLVMNFKPNVIKHRSKQSENTEIIWIVAFSDIINVNIRDLRTKQRFIPGVYQDRQRRACWLNRKRHGLFLDWVLNWCWILK